MPIDADTRVERAISPTAGEKSSRHMTALASSRPALARVACAAIALLFVATAVTLPPSTSGHRLPEAGIFSRYVQGQVTAEGNITAAEWQDAAVVDLSAIPFNTATAYMLIRNNGTMLHIAYDVTSDTTQGANDAAGIAFDGDHNGAPTPQGDGEYSVRASNDSACLPFVSARCHYVYLGPGTAWTPQDAMDQALPFHGGLWAAVGFGPSQREAAPHRMYEFSIPLALIGRPTAAVKAGDIVGFYASHHSSPFVGVWDGDSSSTASWPDNSPLGPNGYGHLYLAAPTGAALTPDYSYKPASQSQPAVHRLSLRNMGQGTDRFDLAASPGLGWTVELRDNLGTLLTNHGGNATLPDVGPLLPGAETSIVVTVIPPPSASPGTVDEMTLEVRPWSDESRTAAATLRSATPIPAPWSDDMEGGAPGWHVLSRPVNDWQLGTPSVTFPTGPTTAHSGANVWGTNLAGNYSLSSFSILETPQVRIPDYVSVAHLVFWHWYRIIGGYGDGAWVEVSSDGGDWTLIPPEAGYPAQRLGGQPAFAGASGAWVMADFNLTSFAGHSVAFRFILWDWLANGVTAGWYIDDVAVQASLPAAGLRLTPPVGFMVGSKLDSLKLNITIQNIGSSDDVFDLSYSQLLGWNVSFLDQFGVPLDDTERPRDGFVDTGLIASGNHVDVTLNVTISASATPGEIESVTVVFRSSLDIGVSANGQYKFQLATPLPYLDDVESGVAGWVAAPGSLWHQVNSCQPSPPAWFISYSPCHSWWYGQDMKGNYATGARTYGNLTSPPIELFNVSVAHLGFRYWYETEPTVEYDQRWIMVKTDNGQWPGKGQAGSYQMGLFFDKTWLAASLDLSSFIGHIVQVRFFFDSIDAQNNAHQGWYIDDVNVSVYTPGSTPPNIALARPVMGERLTAGVPQAIVWDASDDSDPPNALRVWVNYSWTGSAPWTPVPSAQAVRGDSSPVTWTPPCENLTGVALNATVADTFGLFSWSGPIRFDLDCRKPAVVSSQPRNPPDVSVKTNVSVTFSEEMNTTAAQSAFSLKTVPGWMPVSGTFSWAGNTMYFVPSSDLRASTVYQANVSASATDISHPGNGLAAPFTWQFTTSSHADSPPDVSIQTPSGGEDWSGHTPTNPDIRNIEWTVSDDFDLKAALRVWVNYTTDSGGSWAPLSPFQPLNGTTAKIPWEVPCADTTQAAIGVDAIDTGGKRRSVASPLFKIDCSPPTIVSYEPTGYVVPPDAKVMVAFNESMNQGKTEAAFDMWKTDDLMPVAGYFSWVGSILTFDPSIDLLRGSTYQVRIITNASDASSPGNKLQAEMTWQFTVAQAPPPRVSTTDPANGTANVPVDLRIITITFTPNTTSFQGAVNITPYINFTMESPVGSSVIIVHIWKKLDLGTRYRIRLNASLILDNLNNHLDGNGDGAGGDDYSFTFTTASSEPPVENEIPPWIWAIPLAAIGFVVPLAAYVWRRKRKEKRRRRRRERKATSVYRETIGPDRRMAGEVASVEKEEEKVSDASLRPPF